MTFPARCLLLLALSLATRADEVYLRDSCRVTGTPEPGPAGLVRVDTPQGVAPKAIEEAEEEIRRPEDWEAWNGR